MRTALFEAVFLFHKHLLKVCISIPLEPASGQQFSGQSVRVKYPRPACALQPPSRGANKVRRAQLAKSTLLTSTLVPLGYFQIF